MGDCFLAITVARYALPHQISTPGGLLNGGSLRASHPSPSSTPDRSRYAPIIAVAEKRDRGYKRKGAAISCGIYEYLFNRAISRYSADRAVKAGVGAARDVLIAFV